jgi:hypothetical protein
MAEASEPGAMDIEKAITLSTNATSASDFATEPAVPTLTKTQKICLAATMACISFLDVSVTASQKEI